MPKLPEDKPNHLLGIADPESAEAVVPFGIDTMDSCNPTRIARHGLLLSADGPLKIKQLKHASDYGPVDPAFSHAALGRRGARSWGRRRRRGVVVAAVAHGVIDGLLILARSPAAAHRATLERCARGSAGAMRV